MNQTLLMSMATVLSVGSMSSVQAVPTYFEGFEAPSWNPGGMTWNNYAGGDIERVVSGTDGITSAGGNGHGRIVRLRAAPDAAGQSTPGAYSPYTKLGGYSNAFGSGFVASLDVYLDPAWAVGSGFDYSVAAHRQAGMFRLRDFIFHVGVIDGIGLVVNGSNSSLGRFGATALQDANGGQFYTVTTAGWYTLEHVFRDEGGILAVDLQLRDTGGTLLHANTRSVATDDIATSVGGNCYGWLAYNNIEGLAIDNTRLAPATTPVPDGGGSLLLLGLSMSGLGLLGLRAT